MDHYLDNPDRWAYRRAYAERNYPVGTRIRLLAMPDDPNPIPAGTCGTVGGGGRRRPAAHAVGQRAQPVAGARRRQL